MALNGSGSVTPIEILLVEDSPSDIDLTREALEDTRVHNRLSVVTDGVEALAFLRKEGKYAGEPHPDLILLDLNLPDMSGHDVLRHLRLARVETPILILSGADDTDSKLKGFGFGADDYMTR